MTDVQRTTDSTMRAERRALANNQLRTLQQLLTIETAADLYALSGYTKEYVVQGLEADFVSGAARLQSRLDTRKVILRHVHLARAFLRNVPYRVVEATGDSLPSFSWIAELCNEPGVLVWPIHMHEVRSWLGLDYWAFDNAYFRETYRARVYGVRP